MTTLVYSCHPRCSIWACISWKPLREVTILPTCICLNDLPQAANSSRPKSRTLRLRLVRSSLSVILRTWSILLFIQCSSFPDPSTATIITSPRFGPASRSGRSSRRTRLHLGSIRILPRPQTLPHPRRFPLLEPGLSRSTSSNPSASGGRRGPGNIPRRPITRASPAYIARSATLASSGFVQLGAVLGVAPALGAGVSYLVVPMATGVLDVLGGTHDSLFS